MSGTLGKQAPAANTNTTLYTVPANTLATININCVNRGTGDSTVRISIGAASPANEDYIEYDAIIPAAGVLERGAIVVSAADVVVVRATTADVTFRAYGITQSTS